MLNEKYRATRRGILVREILHLCDQTLLTGKWLDLLFVFSLPTRDRKSGVSSPFLLVFVSSKSFKIARLVLEPVLNHSVHGCAAVVRTVVVVISIT